MVEEQASAFVFRSWRMFRRPNNTTKADFLPDHFGEGIVYRGCINNTFHLLVFTAFYGISSSIVRIFYHVICLLMVHCRSEAWSLAPTPRVPDRPSQVARNPTANTTVSPPTDRSAYEDELPYILLAAPSQ